MIKGLRRLAGFTIFNKTFSSSNAKELYDALHLFIASIRSNKPKLTHYLSGIDGCGHKTEMKIRE